MHPPCRPAAFDCYYMGTSRPQGALLLDSGELADSQHSHPDPILKQGPTGAEITWGLLPARLAYCLTVAFCRGATVTEAAAKLGPANQGWDTLLLYCCVISSLVIRK